MSLSGKTIVVTGASSGLGETAAREFARRGAVVVPIGRSPRKAQAVAVDLGVEPLTADFAHLAEVRGLAATLLDRCPKIDVLVNNAAGIWPRRIMTEDGNEKSFQVNALAPYLLTRLLLDRVLASGGRVINTSSQTVEDRKQIDLDDLDVSGEYEPYEAYSLSKLALALLTREFARRYPELPIADFHPGVYVAGLARELPMQRVLAMPPMRHVVEFFVSTAEEGAKTMIHLAETQSPLRGDYYADSRRTDAGRSAEDADVAGRLWDIAARRVGLPG
ncbi:short-chain dehydrogenase [Amycolatopsis sp. WAC 01375]|uniref:SDR family NAD(P)-dependent oxidoreductase n=1 Tax=unclassified Amycolatopsis TaxID=2618356 RepID=UPI000F76E0A9|nr:MULTISPECIES: SDR family NAD(P)-dependent oxidoreductase [unclassified Amycolatopsis]RSM80762.1 short-chain dehydrogenase [Amycolatopsis sp. WAC 01375]RSN34628.1 short-chain dehydrogenase [Amycolatopsis sp. WAC 01416]